MNESETRRLVYPDDGLSEDRLLAIKERVMASTKVDQEGEQRAAVRPVRMRRRLAAAAAAVATALAFVIWSPFRSNDVAIGGWTPQPQTIDASTLEAAAPVCQGLLSNVLGGVESPAWTDRRGNGLIVAYRTGNVLGLCLLVQDESGQEFVGEGATMTELGRLQGTLRVDGISGMEAGGSGVTAVIGQTSSSVHRVVVIAPGWMADASIHDGYWLAWWPSSTDIVDVSVAAYNEDGDRIGSWSPQG